MYILVIYFLYLQYTHHTLYSLYTLRLLFCYRDDFTALDCHNLYNNAYELIKHKPECFDLMDTLFTYIEELNPCKLAYFPYFPGR